MSVEIIKEDGTIVSNANCYTDSETADIYFSTRLNSEVWDNSSADNRAKSLIMATRAIDNYLQHRGYKALYEHSVEYPRVSDVYMNTYLEYYIFPEKELNEATCELALLFLSENMLLKNDMDGIASIEVAGSIKIQTQDKKEDQIIPEFIYKILSKYASKKSGSGSVKMKRG